MDEVGEAVHRAHSALSLNFFGCGSAPVGNDSMLTSSTLTLYSCSNERLKEP